MSPTTVTLKSLEQMLQQFYESPGLAGTRALPLIDAQIPALREAIDMVEYTEKGLAEWRALALSNSKQAEAARATARIAIGHLQALLNERRTAQESWDAECAARDWLTSTGN